MILESLIIDPAALLQRTGWELKPEGACKGERCVPLPGLNLDAIDARVLAARLGMPLVSSEPSGLWSLGPESGSRALSSVEAPDLTLPAFDGQPFNLHALRGRKVLLVAWASW